MQSRQSAEKLTAPSLVGPYRKARAHAGGPAPSLSEIAYDRFMEALFSRRLSPGAFLSQTDLVEMLDVPVGPVRDALRVLQTEGLVSIRARSGIEVAKPDLAMARNTYQIRGILERAAVRVYAETAPMSAIIAHEQAHATLLSNLGSDDPSDADVRVLDKLDPALHIEIIGALRNPLVEDTYRRIHSLLNLILLERNLSGPLMGRTLHEHQEILAACRKRDPDAAEKALEEHFARALDRAMTFL